MRVRFWGTRGSIPVPGPETLRYGGNTPCVEVRTDDGTLIIFDCGTGARKLGLTLARSGPVRAHLFIGHTHADHIQGLPFFLPAFLPGSHLTIYGPSGTNRSLRDAIRAQMEYDFFPIPFQDLPAQAEFRELGEEELTIGGIRIQSQFLNHTAPCLGYRVESDGSTLVYSTDHEPHAPSLWRPDRSDGAFETDAMLHAGDARHAEFLRGADLVIHDSQYTASEYPFKIGWGHSPVEYVVDVALVARVKALALFHHDPGRTDDGLDRILEASRARVAATGIGMKVIGADEGTDLTLTPGQVPSRPAEGGAPATRAVSRARVLVADDDESISKLLDRALSQDGYEVVLAVNGAEAVALASQQTFDLILLDAIMPVLDGFAACRQMRADKRLELVPIVMLTARTGDQDVLAGFGEGVTDYMTKPFAVSQVRALVRAWLTRAAIPTS